MDVHKASVGWDPRRGGKYITEAIVETKASTLVDGQGMSGTIH